MAIKNLFAEAAIKSCASEVVPKIIHKFFKTRKTLRLKISAKVLKNKCEGVYALIS